MSLKQQADKEYGSPYWHIHRADLHRGLLECATGLGVEVYLDSRVIDVDYHAARLTVAGGREYGADLIVASDGLHSMCRHVVIGRTGAPTPTGQMAYRVTFPTRKLSVVPQLKEPIATLRNNHWIGPRGTILSYSLEGINDTINFVFSCDVDTPDGKRMLDVNQRVGRAEEVRKAFKDWDPRTSKMLECRFGLGMEIVHPRRTAKLDPLFRQAVSYRRRCPRYDALPSARSRNGHRRRRDSWRAARKIF